MLMNFIIGILLASSFYYLYLASKYRNEKYTYRVKNRVYNVISKYNKLNENINLGSYQYLKNLLDSKIKALLEIKDIRDIRQIKVYEDKRNSNLDINSILKELIEISKNNDEGIKDVKDILNYCIEITEIILKVRKPFLYYKYLLKKIKFNRNLKYIIQKWGTTTIEKNKKLKNEVKLKRKLEKNKEILLYTFA